MTSQTQLLTLEDSRNSKESTQFNSILNFIQNEGKASRFDFKFDSLISWSQC